jgi:hypothetical protein
MTDQEIIDYLKSFEPPGWIPKCKTITCYIKNQHPSCRTKFQIPKDMVITFYGKGWKHAVFQDWKNYLKANWNQIVKPYQFKDPKDYQYNRTRKQNCFRLIKNKFGIPRYWHTFWNPPQ